ncbi:hypothetical protein CY0110_14405 [Crocosphaera chwakensis CCY0110]|uniref:Uncharacterized protein n=1 Tax=Crocosphaera chwakensis CCY0110 TaxID=391612 RepID=A3IZ04_9CHRO|nr:hypothetical protein CY0110_14405 [Crocosphaera chwakensis CCY0110]
MLLAGIKYGNWLADCDRRQKNVLITLKFHKYFQEFLKIILILITLRSIIITLINLIKVL